MIKNLVKIISFLALCFPKFAAADVNIAVIAPKSGEYKTFGAELFDGVQIAVNEINEQGGLKGEKINLITVDDRCDDRLSVSTAQMIALHTTRTDKIHLVIGPYCDNAFSKVAETFAQAGIFQIIPTSVSSTEAKRSYKGLVKMVGFQERQGLDFYNYYTDYYPGKKFALVYDSRIRNVVEIASVVKDQFLKNGKEADFKSYNFANYNQDWSQIADDMHHDGVEVAYILGKSKSVSKLSRALKEDDEDFVIFTNRYQVEDNYAKIMGSLAEGSFMLALPSLKDNPAFTETLVKLRLLGVEPEGLSVYGYSAVQLWEELVKKSNSFAYNKLSRALNNNKIETGWGETMFTNGNPENSINYSIYQLRAGEYTQVY